MPVAEELPPVRPEHRRVSFVCWALDPASDKVDYYIRLPQHKLQDRKLAVVEMVVAGFVQDQIGYHF